MSDGTSGRPRAYMVMISTRPQWWRLARVVHSERIMAYDVKDAARQARDKGWRVVGIVPDIQVECRECGQLHVPARVTGPSGEAATLRICPPCLNSPNAPPIVPLGEVPE